MEISLRLERAVPVLSLGGRLDARGAMSLDEKLGELKGPHVVLDCTGVGYLSSMGVRSLITGEQNLRKAGGGLLLAGLSPMGARGLGVSGGFGGVRRFGPAAEAGEGGARGLRT